MHVRLMDNLVYDQINMGTFNFVISAFDNLLYDIQPMRNMMPDTRW